MRIQLLNGRRALPGVVGAAGKTQLAIITVKVTRDDKPLVTFSVSMDNVVTRLSPSHEAKPPISSVVTNSKEDMLYG